MEDLKADFEDENKKNIEILLYSKSGLVKRYQKDNWLLAHGDKLDSEHEELCQINKVKQLNKTNKSNGITK